MKSQEFDGKRAGLRAVLLQISELRDHNWVRFAHIGHSVLLP